MLHYEPTHFESSALNLDYLHNISFVYFSLLRIDGDALNQLMEGAFIDEKDKNRQRDDNQIIKLKSREAVFKMCQGRKPQ